jgi:hypothetical protein
VDVLQSLGLTLFDLLTAYDAAYLELAMRLGIPLATLDRELRKACRRGWGRASLDEENHPQLSILYALLAVRLM